MFVWECVYWCVRAAIEQHSRKFYGLIVWSLVTFLTFPECWTIGGCLTKFSCNYFWFRVCCCQSERLSLLGWTISSLILISSNGNICYSFWWLFHSIFVCVFVCSVAWVTFISSQYVRAWIDCFCLLLALFRFEYSDFSQEFFVFRKIL